MLEVRKVGYEDPKVRKIFSTSDLDLFYFLRTYPPRAISIRVRRHLAHTDRVLSTSWRIVISNYIGKLFLLKLGYGNKYLSQSKLKQL